MHSPLKPWPFFFHAAPLLTLHFAGLPAYGPFLLAHNERVGAASSTPARAA